jgi:CBS domain-containing protein
MAIAVQELTAADRMQRDIVTANINDTLGDALKIMTANHVTGLPVMDNKCRCVGLISATDILNYENDHASVSPERETTQFFDPDTEQWEDIPVSAFSIDDFAGVRVSDVMTHTLISAGRDMPLQVVARRMLDEQIHRILVMDKNGQLYGIISAYDFVRVVAEQ